MISAFSHLAEQVGNLRGLPPGRVEMMLTGYGLLLVLGLGGAGLIPSAMAWWRKSHGSPGPRRRAPGQVPLEVQGREPLVASGLSKRFGSLQALDPGSTWSSSPARSTR